MLVPVLLFIVGLLFLIKGGDWFVDGASALARRFHLPELLIGATVVSIGTTLPEVMVSTMSAVSGHGEIAYGNAIGSVICNSALIAAITIAVRPGKVDPKTLRVPVAFFFAAAAIYCVAAYAMGEFTRPLGFVMLAMFVAYMVANVLQMKKAPAAAEAEAEAENAGEEMSLTKTLVLLVLGAVLIALGANLLVDNGTLIAQALGVPESVIALTFVALGTSLPELVTAITSLVKGCSDLSLGNIVGANVFNLVLVSGVSDHAGTLHRAAELHPVRHQFQPCAGDPGHAGCHDDHDPSRTEARQAVPCTGHYPAVHLRRLLRHPVLPCDIPGDTSWKKAAAQKVQQPFCGSLVFSPCSPVPPSRRNRWHRRSWWRRSCRSRPWGQRRGRPPRGWRSGLRGRTRGARRRSPAGSGVRSQQGQVLPVRLPRQLLRRHRQPLLLPWLRLPRRLRRSFRPPRRPFRLPPGTRPPPHGAGLSGSGSCPAPRWQRR